MSVRSKASGAIAMWEGPQFASHSLAIVNRELCSRLLERGPELGIQPFEAAERIEAAARNGDERSRRIAARIGQELSNAPDVTVRHQWPPDLSPAASGRLVLIQPWEFGSLPRDWIEPIARHVDEVWAYTPYVRDCYVNSGVDPEKVFVVPLGVDPAHFQPGAEPLELATRRSFKFLFVGGTIYRKGIDVLLDAYAASFAPGDDVCLVVKATGADASYADQHQREAIEAFRDRADTPELLYLEDDLCEADMPRLYAAADCLVHPYRGEGFGLPIAEAMACALPVVVTEGGAADAFCEEEWSYKIPSKPVALSSRFVGDIETVDLPTLVEPDAKALAGILRRVHADPDQARTRGFAAREQIRTRFSWDHAVDAVLERVEDLRTRPQREVGAVAEPRLDESTGADAVEAGSTPVVWHANPFNYSGYAKVSRSLLPALDRAGLQVRLDAFGTDARFAEDFNAQLQRNPSDAVTWNRLLNRRVAGGVGVCLHPPVAWDGYRFFREFRGKHPGLDAYVGFTMFETDRLPGRWAAECNSMDEVWVPNEFNREVFASSGVDADRLRVLHLGLDVEPFRKASAPCPIPGQRGFTFLSVFQWSQRKGWDVLLDAWAQAFGPDDDVCLVLRAYPGYQKKPSIGQRIDDFLRSIGRPRGSCAPIVLLDDFVADDDMPSLYAAADAFVLPSRGEALGIPYLEAMAAGLPTLAPDWGGQLQFMTDENSYLIEIDGLEPVGAEQHRENPFYTSDLNWASPSRTHTAERMREVFENADAARDRGRRARSDIFEHWSLETSVADFERLSSDLGRRAPARDAVPDRFAAPASVLWNSPLYDLSESANEARDFAAGLDAAGVLLKCLAFPATEAKAELGDDERTLLWELEQRPVGENGELVHVQHASGRLFRHSPGLKASVGRTTFETDSIPGDWVAPCNSLDEVWVPSQFHVESFASAGVDREKLHVIHRPVDAKGFGAPVEPLEIPGRRGFAFLSVLDWSQCEGWDVLLRAFAGEFEADEDVCLVLDVSRAAGERSSSLRKRARRFLRKHAGCDFDAVAPILWLDSDASAGAAARLYGSADAFVLPNRGAASSRACQEAMACGLPAIATGWGANADLINEDNGYPLASKLVAVAGPALKEAAEFRGQRWAEPSLEHLRERMRQLFAEPEEAKRRGERARRDVLERFDRDVVARSVCARLDLLSTRSRVAPGPSLEASQGGTPCSAA